MNENQTNNGEKKSVTIVKNILNAVINFLIIIVLVVSLAVATLALTSKANGGVPSILGYSFHTIQTSSMEGGSDVYEGGSYDVGDLVIGKVTNGNPNEVYELGDIVVYTTEDDNTPTGVGMIVHRVIEINEDENGTRSYTTQGDNNDIADANTHTASQIVAVTYDHDYNGKVFKGIGKALDFIRTGQGFFFVVLLPMIIFFLYEIVRVVLNAVNYRNAKAKEEIEQAKEGQQAAIDAAVAAALAKQAELNAQNAAAQPAPQQPAAAPAPAQQPAPVQEAAPAEAPAEKPAENAPKAPELTPEQMEQFKQFMAFQQAQQAMQAQQDQPKSE